MTRIRKNENVIECHGHATEKVACAMLTALIVSLIKNLTERLGYDVNFVLEPGRFELYPAGIAGDGKALIDAFTYSLDGLVASYPDSFQFV